MRRASGHCTIHYQHSYEYYYEHTYDRHDVDISVGIGVRIWAEQAICNGLISSGVLVE
jgi:hypothetical protein